VPRPLPGQQVTKYFTDKSSSQNSHRVGCWGKVYTKSWRGWGRGHWI